MFHKIERERAALGGAVFDVLGKSFSDTSLRQLLLDAIRYGDQPEVKARLTREIDRALDLIHLIGALLDREAVSSPQYLSQLRLFLPEELPESVCVRWSSGIA